MNRKKKSHDVEALRKAIAESGLKKSFIAGKLGVTKQSLTHWTTEGNVSPNYVNSIGLCGIIPMKMSKLWPGVA